MNDLDALQPAIASGDAEAFGVFLSAVELSVRRSLSSFATRLDVEAVVQESFLRLWQVAPRFVPDGRENGLLRLLLRIARNLALDEVRRRREITPADEALSVEADAPVVPVDPLLRKTIQQCFDKLPERPSQAMRARLENEGSEADSMSAERCGMTMNTFLQNVTRARKLLAECLKGHGVQLFEEMR